MAVTTSDGVALAYDDVGSGDPIVLVHGITDRRDDWRPIVDRLSATHRCVTLDLRGHGESGDADDYSALAMATDVVAVVDALALDRPMLIGHSLGAMVATAAALRAPVRGVVNIDQPLRMSDFAAALAPLESMLRGTPAEFADAMTLIFSVLNGDRLDDRTAEALAARASRARQDVVLGAWDVVFTTPPAALDELIDAMVPAITVPYLALLGNDAGPGYDDWLRARIAHVEIEHWPEHGHYLHLVDPDRFAERIRAFVATCR